MHPRTADQIAILRIVTGVRPRHSLGHRLTVVEVAADTADTVNRMSTTREAVCEGCGQTTVLPMIQFDEADDAAIIEGLCAGREQNFGMEIGAPVRLLEPDENGDTVVQFIHPEENAIRVRSFKTGATKVVSWSEFEKIT